MPSQNCALDVLMRLKNADAAKVICKPHCAAVALPLVCLCRILYLTRRAITTELLLDISCKRPLPCRAGSCKAALWATTRSLFNPPSLTDAWEPKVEKETYYRLPIN